MEVDYCSEKTALFFDQLEYILQTCTIIYQTPMYFLTKLKFIHSFSPAWHLRLRQYYPGQEVINEHNDPNLAETPHYKEKQTILPHPISAEVEKKTQTPVKRTHDGKPKKDKKDPSQSPMINEQSTPKEVCIKTDEAKIDMRKLVIEHKTPHKKSSSSSSSSNSLKKHSSSSSLSSSKASKKDRNKHKSSSGSDSRSHSSKKSHSSSSEKHRRDENRKSSSSDKHKSSESSAKKEDLPKIQPIPSQSATMNDSTLQNQEISDSNKDNEIVLPAQVSSSHTTVPVVSPAPPAPPAFVNPDIPCQHPPQVILEPQTVATPPFDILPPLPPLPKEIPPPPIEIPPPPPPPPEEPKSMASKSGTSPDSSTTSTASAPKVRKLNNGDKAAATSSDLLGSIMASMDSPRNASNF